MTMTSSQEALFSEGAGCSSGSCSFTADNLILAIQSIGVVVIFLYVSWLCIKAYDEYSNTNSKNDATDMILTWIRSIFIMMVLLYLFVN